DFHVTGVQTCALPICTDIKQLNFEIKESDGIIKIIPHTENDEKSRIVPITHVEVSADANGTNVRMNTKPRRIDLGGLYLATGAKIGRASCRERERISV